MNRIIFIHGFGEKPNIFDKIHPAFPHTKLFIDNWMELGNQPRKNFTALDYATHITEKYQINQNDLIIGHSLGGWIAYHTKFITNCKTIQIASWTDMDHVKFPVNNFKVIALLVKLGLTFNRFSRKYFLTKQYKGLASEQVFIENYNNLMYGNKNNVLNQLMLILHGKANDDMPEPDLRIHSHKDRLIRKPKQNFHVVSGDHFNLHTHPDEVIQAIQQYLKSI
ncbi:MAG: alpha/beta hydrolase [Bacteroidota bacterium]